MKKITLIGSLLFLLIGCKQKLKVEDFSTNEQLKNMSPLDAFLQEKGSALFGYLPKTAEDDKYPITEEKVALGKKLYFDVRLSKDNTISCNSCHNLSTFGVDNRSFSPGNDGGLGGRNSPTVLNAALHSKQFWDGRAKDVEEQAGGPILNPVEMAIPSEDFLVKRLHLIEEYGDLFAKAFPADEDPISYWNVQQAIAAFERKLITPSKLDDYLKGDLKALTQQQKDGMKAFIETGCTTCHTGNALGGTMFQKFGVYGNYWDFTKSAKIDNGVFDISKNESDKYVFKVPSLRNVEKTGPYFHDGSVSSLKAAVDIMAQTQLNKKLTDKEQDDIVAFLSSLTGDIPAAYKQP